MLGAHVNERKFKDDVLAGKNGFCLIYGRKGCESSELALSFVKASGSSIYYRAADGSEDVNQRFFGNVTAEKYSLLHVPETYKDAFEMIALKETENVVLAFDRAECILKKDLTFFEELMFFMKKNDSLNIHVFFATDDVNWAFSEYDELVGAYSKLDLGKCRSEELTFLEMVRIFPNKPIREIIQMYGITGGVADYIPCWSKKLTLKESVIRHVLSPRGYLYHEAEDFLHTRLRETSVYETILSALASGVNKLNDIYKLTGYSRAKISVYMKNLASFGVVSKTESFETGGWENAKKGVYTITDTFIHFWFTFVYPHQSALSMVSPETFYERFIEPGLDEYMNQYFVKVCREYLALVEQSGSLPIVTSKEGTWIGKKGRIDIILQNDVRENVVGYCSWSEKNMSRAHLDELEESMKQARVKAVKKYMFSAGTFDHDLTAYAQNDPEIELVDMNEL